MILFILLQVVLTGLFAVGLALLNGSLTSSISAVSFFLATVGAYGFSPFHKQKFEMIFKKMKWYETTLFLIVAYVQFYHFQYLFYESDAKIMSLHANNYGDLPLHITYIKYFASGANFWPANPLFPQLSLNYPFGMDLYNAVLDSLGIPLRLHLFLVGFVLSLVTLVFLFQWSGIWGILSLFLGGGIASLDFFKTRIITDSMNLMSWKSFMLSVWVTQRGFLIAIPIGVYLILTLLNKIKNGLELTIQEKFIFALLWASLVFFHFHTFLFLTIFIVGAIFYYRRASEFYKMGLLAAALSLPFFIRTVLSVETGSFIHFKWGWDKSATENYFIFWLKNWGFYWPMIFLSLFFVWTRFKEYKFEALFTVIAFFFFGSVMFAPWAWDNIKLLIWVFLLFTWLIQKTVIENASIFNFIKPLAIILCCFSGAMSLWSAHLHQQKVTLYDLKDIYHAQAVLKDVPAGSIILTQPIHNHPVAFLGFPLLMGFTGQLWSHGIAYNPTEVKMQQIFSAKNNFEQWIEELPFEYLYWGPAEQSANGLIPNALLTHFELISQSGNVSLYRKKIY